MPVTVENRMLNRASLPTSREVDGVGVAPQQAARRAFWRTEWFLFLLFVGSNLLLFGIFSYWPMLSNLYLSLTRWDMISPVKTFVGPANFAYLLNDNTFRAVLRNLAVFTAGAVGGSLVLGLATALLLNQKLRWRNGARAVLFAPTLLSGAAIESQEMQAFFADNLNFRSAVEQLALTEPQDSARVFIPNGDQIIGGGLERITINLEDPQVVFDDVANTLTQEAQPVIEAIAALG